MNDVQQKQHPVLRRERIIIPDTPAELLGETKEPLAERAEKVLGYRVLAERATQFAALAEVLQALKDLNINPFNRGDVEAYKKRELWRAASLWQVRPLRTLAFLIMGIVGAIMFSSQLPPPGNAAIATSGIILAIVGLVFAGANAIGWHQHGTVSGWDWYWGDFKGNRQEIPIAIVEMAIRIEEKCPTVFAPNQQNFITVHSLMREQRVADPFLAVTLSTPRGYAHIYVARWDEPRFDAQVH